MRNKPIEVFIVDDSRVARELLSHIIELDPELKVIGCADNGEQALKWLQNHSCDVITMDIHMPNLNGFEVTQKIMESRPLPTIIISSGYTQNDSQLAFKALEIGALAILEKPMGLGDANYARKTKEIVDTIKMIAGIKVMTRHQKRSSVTRQSQPLPIIPQIEIKAVGIGASLGGPLAIAKILEELPASFPVPIFIVQHIVAGFIENFIEWLQERSKLKIYLAKDGMVAKPGCIYLAADACHMKIKIGGVIFLDNTYTSGIQPSVNELFKSLADIYDSHCIGVLLTGMGRDGAEELLNMKQKGAYTIAQDEESSLMFGMPKEAILLGAARQVLPLNMIAPTLNALVAKRHL